MKTIRNLFIPAALALAFTFAACSKDDNNEQTFTNTVVIDGVEKPVLSAKTNAELLENNKFQIYLYFSADKKEYMLIEASKEHHDGKDTDLTRKEAGREGWYWGIDYYNPSSVFATSGNPKSSTPVFLKGKFYIKHIDNIDGQPAFEIRLENGEVKDSVYGDGKQHTVSLSYRGKAELH